MHKPFEIRLSRVLSPPGRHMLGWQEVFVQATESTAVSISWNYLLDTNVFLSSILYAAASNIKNRWSFSRLACNKKWRPGGLARKTADRNGLARARATNSIVWTVRFGLHGYSWHPYTATEAPTISVEMFYPEARVLRVDDIDLIVLYVQIHDHQRSYLSWYFLRTYSFRVDEYNEVCESLRGCMIEQRSSLFPFPICT